MPAQALVGLLWEGIREGGGVGVVLLCIFQCGSKRRVRVYPDVCFALSSLETQI